jgi:hypothetical protein
MAPEAEFLKGLPNPAEILCTTLALALGAGYDIPPISEEFGRRATQ